MTAKALLWTASPFACPAFKGKLSPERGTTVPMFQVRNVTCGCPVSSFTSTKGLPLPVVMSMRSSVSASPDTAFISKSTNQSLQPVTFTWS